MPQFAYTHHIPSSSLLLLLILLMQNNKSFKALIICDVRKNTVPTRLPTSLFDNVKTHYDVYVISKNMPIM